jgi:hypothetical protein
MDSLARMFFVCCSQMSHTRVRARRARGTHADAGQSGRAARGAAAAEERADARHRALRRVLRRRARKAGGRAQTLFGFIQ